MLTSCTATERRRRPSRSRARTYCHWQRAWRPATTGTPFSGYRSSHAAWPGGRRGSCRRARRADTAGSAMSHLLATTGCAGAEVRVVVEVRVVWKGIAQKSSAAVGAERYLSRSRNKLPGSSRRARNWHSRHKVQVRVVDHNRWTGARLIGM